jgi:TolA-binding protein
VIFFRTLIILFLFNSVSAQSNATISEVFFLDLGIVIEPSTGEEEYNRVVESPSEEINFQVKKAKSGAIYMAASSEMLASLERINNRIAKLESSFQEKLFNLQQENELLKNMITDIDKRPSMVNEVASKLEVEREVSLISPIKDQAEPLVTLKSNNNKQPEKLIEEFNSKDYMAGVFAYQQDNFQLAIQYFANLHLINADKNVSDNVIYWMADSYQQLGDIDNAIIYLDMVIEKNNSEHIDDALIKKGLLHRKRGEKDQSLVVFNKLVNNYPKSEYVKLARMEIKRAEIYQ